MVMFWVSFWPSPLCSMSCSTVSIFGVGILFGLTNDEARRGSDAKRRRADLGRQ